MKNVIVGFCLGIALFTFIFCSKLQKETVKSAEPFIFRQDIVSMQYILHTIGGMPFDTKGRYSYWWNTAIVGVEVKWLL